MLNIYTLRNLIHFFLMCADIKKEACKPLSNSKLDYIIKNIKDSLISSNVNTGEEIDAHPIVILNIENCSIVNGNHDEIDKISGVTKSTIFINGVQSTNLNIKDNVMNIKEVDDINVIKSVPTKKELDSIKKIPKSAFQLFSDDARNDVIENLNTLIKVEEECNTREVNTVLQKAWKEMNSSEREHYELEEIKIREEYNLHVQNFESKYPGWINEHNIYIFTSDDANNIENTSNSNSKTNSANNRRSRKEKSNTKSSNTSTTNKIKNTTTTTNKKNRFNNKDISEDDRAIIEDFRLKFPNTYNALESCKGTVSTRKKTTLSGKTKKIYIVPYSNAYCLFLKHYTRKYQKELEGKGRTKEEIAKMKTAAWNDIKFDGKKTKFKNLADKDVKRHEVEWIEYMKTHLRDWIEYISENKYNWSQWKNIYKSVWEEWYKNNDIYRLVDKEITDSSDILVIPNKYFRKDFIKTQKLDHNAKYDKLFENFDNGESRDDKIEAIHYSQSLSNKDNTCPGENKRKNRRRKKKLPSTTDNTSASNITGKKRKKKTLNKIRKNKKRKITSSDTPSNTISGDKSEVNDEEHLKSGNIDISLTSDYKDDIIDDEDEEYYGYGSS